MSTSPTIRALSIYGHIVDIKREKWRIRVAGYALIVHDDKILLVNTKSTGKWSFPGGEVEIGETLQQAMKREVGEEAGIDIAIEKFLDFREVFFYYDPSDQAFQNYSFFFRCRPLTTNASDKQNVPDDECDRPTWVNLNSLKENDLQPGFFEIVRLLSR